MFDKLVMCFSLVLLASCADRGDAPAGAVLAKAGEGPENARPGACYGKDRRPAVIETVTERVLVEPAKFSSANTLISPAVYAVKTRPELVKGGETYYFEVPCQSALTRDFVSSVQRSLRVRNVYHGEVSGVLDRATRRAIRAYQLPDLNSDILSTKSAISLGLIPDPSITK